MILNVKNKISDIFISMLHFIYGIFKTGGFLLLIYDNMSELLQHQSMILKVENYY